MYNSICYSVDFNRLESGTKHNARPFRADIFWGTFGVQKFKNIYKKILNNKINSYILVAPIPKCTVS